MERMDPHEKRRLELKARYAEAAQRRAEELELSNPAAKPKRAKESSKVKAKETVSELEGSEEENVGNGS